jgi:hypothetical protein
LFFGQALGQKSTIEGQRFSGLDLKGISVQAETEYPDVLQPGLIPTLGELQNTTPWVWLWCERCQHHAPLACAVAGHPLGRNRINSDRMHFVSGRSIKTNNKQQAKLTPSDSAIKGGCCAGGVSSKSPLPGL